MRFHTDENVTEAVALGLRRRGFDVTTTAQAELLGATDQEQLGYCFREGRVIITHDEDMLRLASSGTAHAGIAYCHQNKYKVGGLILKLLALPGRVTAEEIRGRVEFL
jgi:predicted nuclease of predicted toxin-antitoxin system